MITTTETLYTYASRVMQHYIKIYLELARKSHGFSNLEAEHLTSLENKIIVIGGLGSPLDASQLSSVQVLGEWQRMQAIPFEPELAVTKGVYIELRQRVKELVEELDQLTDNFMNFDANQIYNQPHFLPILQRLANVSSKAELKRRIGTVSDHKISRPAAEQFALLLNLKNADCLD